MLENRAGEAGAGMSPTPIRRVCMLTSGHSLMDDRIFYKEAISLQRAGYNVVVIASTGKVDEVREGVRLLGFSLSRWPSQCGIRGLLGRLMFLRLGFRVDAEIYHFHEPELLSVAVLLKLAQRVARGKRVSIIHDIHDFYLHEAWLDTPPGRYRTFRLNLAEKWDRLLHGAIDFVIGSEECKIERALRYGVPPARTAVIENYARTDLFPFSPKPFDPRHFAVAYAGGLSFHRGLKVLASNCVLLGKAVGISPTLILAGYPHSEAELQDALRYCRENAELVDLKYLGMVPHSEVPRALAEADVCCALFYSQRYEKVLGGKAGPIKLYEYMACGKPVIVTDAPALRYVIERADCGIVVSPQDGAEGVANALKFLYENPARLAEMGKNGRSAVEKWFNWSLAEAKLLGVYATLVDSHRSARVEGQ